MERGFASSFAGNAAKRNSPYPLDGLGVEALKAIEPYAEIILLRRASAPIIPIPIRVIEVGSGTVVKLKL